MSTRSLWAVGAVVLGVTLAQSGGARPQDRPPYSVTVLGTLGGARSRPTSINERGVVVGSSETAAGTVRAFLWTDGELRDLGTLPGGGDSAAHDINNRGQVVGGAVDVEGRERAVLWSGDTPVDLGTLGGETASARAINDRGVVVGTSEVAPDRRRAFIWKNGLMTAILPQAHALPLSAQDINERGDVVGVADQENMIGTYRRAFLLRNGRLWIYGYSDDDVGATGVNGRGVAVGWEADNDGYGTVWLWRARKERRLYVTGYDGSAGADAINDRGLVVGTIYRSELRSVRAFVWEQGELRYLERLVDPSGGWRFSEANDINNRGQIVGVGSQNGGPEVAVLLTPRGPRN